MNRIAQDFVSQEPRTFPFKIGHRLASSLTGFIVGVVVASIVWSVGAWYFMLIQSITSYNPATNQTSGAPTALPRATAQKTSTP